VSTAESDLRKLRRLATERARDRNEKVTTVHLLAAVYAFGGSARILLEERRLDEPKLASAARAFDELDHGDDPVEEVLSSARHIARHSAVPSRGSFLSKRGEGARPAAAPEPSAIHVLVVLVSNRRYAAYRALSQCGVDITRLRAAARRIALGVTAPPRKARGARVAKALAQPTAQPAQALHDGRRDGGAKSDKPAAKKRDSGKRRAQVVPLIPPLAPPLRKALRSSPAPAPAAPDQAMSSSDIDALWLSEDQFPTLAPLHNLSLAALSGALPPQVAREAEVEQALDVLGKRHGNNPLLVGPAGVGKTTVAHAIAARLLSETSRPRRVMLALPAAELLTGTSARGSLAERLTALRAEVKRAEGRVVLFIDEIHELLGSGAIDEVAGELKAALAAGELPVVGTTSHEEYRRCIESDAALARRFSIIDVEEPCEADAFLMLRAASRALSDHHEVDYSDDALAAAVSWSIRYLPGRALPDKAFGALDLAGARLARAPTDGGRTIELEHVAEVIAELAQVPVDRLLETDRERMLGLSQLLCDRVVGHDDACERIAAVLRRNAAGLRGRRPIGTFLLLGPTGVGKTETAKAIADALFHSPDAMTRLDMSEYAEPHAVARLIGAPPGYVGHEAGGLLTEALRRRPYQVILLDEIEKAHRDVLQAFLQVFDEGRMTDGRGRTVDFNNAVIVLTSNLGAEALRDAMTTRTVGFARRETPTDDAQMQKLTIDAARAALPPELYNRLDEVLFFRHLSRPDVRAVAKHLLAELCARLATRGITLDIEDGAIDALLEHGGYDIQFGARPMRRAIVRLVEAPLADMILRGELEAGGVALVSAIDGEVVVDALERRVTVA
jgi:ATP-dependent Clp protease ATP-binding subunit ClpC